MKCKHTHKDAPENMVCEDCKITDDNFIHECQEDTECNCDTYLQTKHEGDFVLSDRILVVYEPDTISKTEHHLLEKDVKEFIRRLKDAIGSAELDWFQDTTDSPFKMTKQIKKEIDKLAGDDLK